MNIRRPTAVGAVVTGRYGQITARLASAAGAGEILVTEPAIANSGVRYRFHLVRPMVNPCG